MILWLALVACFGLAACGSTPRDRLSADVCRAAPPPLADLSPQALGEAAGRAEHVVRGRIRFTGSITDVDGDRQRELGYVIVDILDFRRGDAWSVDPKLSRSFPLLGNQPEIRALGCRTGEAFFFFVDLPAARGGGEPWPGGTPDPVFRAFGPRAVTLFAIAPESAADAVHAALARTP